MPNKILNQVEKQENTINGSQRAFFDVFNIVNISGISQCVKMDYLMQSILFFMQHSITLVCNNLHIADLY